MAVLDLLARLIMKLPFERKLLCTFYAMLIGSFIPSIVMIFADCHPIELAWQIYPNPGGWYGASPLKTDQNGT